MISYFLLFYMNFEHSEKYQFIESTNCQLLLKFKILLGHDSAKTETSLSNEWILLIHNYCLLKVMY